MNTYNLKFTKTLSQLILAILILTAVTLLAPGRSEAAFRIAARVGPARVAVASDPCCIMPVKARRNVVVRSAGRQRIVVRNDYPRHHKCGGRTMGKKHRRFQHKVWVPGHFAKKVKRNGRLKRIWIPGHWARI